MKYFGYTHYVPVFGPFLFFWRRLFCKRGWHLWDEVWSTGKKKHYLSCDACGEKVNITIHG